MSNLLLSKIGHVISEFPLAFKQTKEVKLFMTLLVKNEEGMLEENLQFHKAMGVDGFIITDNNSTDSTPDIIRKYKQKGWIKEVIEEKATNYEQKDWVDRMIWKAKTIYKADWIINADADELWYASTGNLKDEYFFQNRFAKSTDIRMCHLLCPVKTFRHFIQYFTVSTQRPQKFYWCILTYIICLTHDQNPPAFPGRLPIWSMSGLLLHDYGHNHPHPGSA